MPTPRSATLGIALLTALALTATACTDSKPKAPTVTEAEKALQDHIKRLMGTGVGNVRDIRITDPGGKNIPCEKAKFKRTYAAEGTKKDLPDLTPTELSNSMFGRLITQVARYELTSFQGGSPLKQMHNAATRTSLTFNVPIKGVFEVQGATDCLPAD